VEGLVKNGFVNTNNSNRILAMEVVNQVFLREERDLNLQRGVNVDPILGAYRGYHEVEECNSCVEGNGLFMHFVTVEAFFQNSCTDCHFGGKGIKCTFRHTSNVQ
jgi:hypothetical protein